MNFKGNISVKSNLFHRQHASHSNSQPMHFTFPPLNLELPCVLRARWKFFQAEDWVQSRFPCHSKTLSATLIFALLMDRAAKEGNILQRVFILYRKARWRVLWCCQQHPDKCSARARGAKSPKKLHPKQLGGSKIIRGECIARFLSARAPPQEGVTLKGA